MSKRVWVRAKEGDGLKVGRWVGPVELDKYVLVLWWDRAGR